jgi:hypothetical protein
MWLPLGPRLFCHPLVKTATPETVAQAFERFASHFYDGNSAVLRELSMIERLLNESVVPKGSYRHTLERLETIIGELSALSSKLIFDESRNLLKNPQGQVSFKHF